MELQNEMTITLRQSIRLGDSSNEEYYDHLDLREPLAGEMLEFNRKAATDPGDALRRLIAKISGVPLAVIDRLTARDFNRASSYLMVFLDPDQSNASVGADEQEGEKGTSGK